MSKLRPSALCLTLIVLFTFTQGTFAQDTEKTKSDIMFRLMDFNARFRMIFSYKDAESRAYLANSAKAQYQAFRQLAEPNLELFDEGRGKLKEIIRGAEKFLLKDEVFNTLTTPDYRNESKPEKGEVLEDRWIDIHKAAEYVLIKEMVVRANFKIYTAFSDYAVAADMLDHGPAASHAIARAKLKQAPNILGGYYNSLKADNNEESRIAINDMVNAFRNMDGDLVGMVLWMYERPNTLVMSAAAQKNDLQLKSKYASSKVWQSGLIREMQENEKFAMVVSPRDMEPLRNKIFIYGKYLRAKAGETPDITFRIVAPGIGIVDYGQIKAVPTIGDRKGYLSTITYHMPLKIEVVDKEGKVEQTFVINEDKEVFSSVFDANFIPRTPGVDVVPFPSDTAYYYALDRNKDRISELLFTDKWNQQAGAMAQLLNDAYGYYKVPNSFYYLYDVKNPEAGYQDIKALVDSTDYAIEHLETQATSATMKATLARMVDKYQEVLERPGISQNVKNLCARNSVTAALLADQVSRALYLLDRCKAINPKDNYVVPFNLNAFLFRSLFDDAAQRVTVLPLRNDLWKY